MPAKHVKADHDQLKDIASTFTAQADALEKIVNDILKHYDPLQSGGWIGEGATKYFQEQTDFTHPTLGRLYKSLGALASATKDVSKIFDDADSEISSFFSSLF